MKSIRRIHGWLGVLFAPSIILFALSGMLQIRGCHESEDGHPPNTLSVRLAMIHMHQTAELPKRRPRPPQPAPPAASEGSAAMGSAAQAPRPPKQEDREEPTNPLKPFFIVMCLALIASSVLGVCIALTSKRDLKLHIGLLVAGIVLPVVLLLV